MKVKTVFLFLLFGLFLVSSFVGFSYVDADKPNPISNAYIKYPTETFIIESQTELDKFIDWSFDTVDNLHWVFSWSYLEEYDLGNQTYLINPLKSLKLDKDVDEIFSKVDLKILKSELKDEIKALKDYPVKIKEKKGVIFVKEPPKTINVHDFEVGKFEFTLDKWELGIILEMGLHSTIVYSGATDTITVTGGTSSVPITFTDLYNADVAGGWGQISLQGTNQFLLNCKLIIGDASTETWFKDVEKYVLFNQVITGSGGTYRCIYVSANANFQLGNLINEANYVTRRGCTIESVDAVYRYYYLIGSSYLSTCNLYSSTFRTLNVIGQTYANEGFLAPNGRIWNCLLDNGAYIHCMSPTYGTYVTINLFNVESTSSYVLVRRPNAASTFEEATGIGLAWGIYFQNVAGTLKDVVFKGCSYIAKMETLAVGLDCYLINVDSDTWAIYWLSDANSKLYRQYEFNLKIIGSDDVAIQSANVTLYNVNGKVGSWLTNSIGLVSTQTLTMGYYQRANGDTLTNYNPYNLTITKSGYDTYSTNFTLSDKIGWTIALSETDTSVISKNLAIAGIFIIALICAVLGGIIGSKD